MTKPMFATRDFKDAGTERSFTAGEKITDVDAGAIANYRAAGLVGDGTSEAEKLVQEIASDAAAAAAAADPAAPKPARRKRTRSKPTTTPA